MYTLTITAKTGPAIQATSEVIANITSIIYDWVGLTVTIYVLNAQSPRTFDLTGVTTITTTPSAKTITIS